jgi:hypothetical protein
MDDGLLPALFCFSARCWFYRWPVCIPAQQFIAVFGLLIGPQSKKARDTIPRPPCDAG